MTEVEIETQDPSGQMYLFGAPKEKIMVPDFIEKPKDDNDILLNIQHEYYTHDRDPVILWKMFPMLHKKAEEMIKKVAREKHLYFDAEEIEAKTMDAVLKYFDKVKKKNFVAGISIVKMLKFQVIETLFHRTMAQKLEDYCEKNNLNLFAMDDLEKMKVRLAVESTV